MICKNCGKENQDDTKFCMCCGFNMIDSDDISSEKTERNIVTETKPTIKNMKKPFVITLISVTILLLSVLIGVLIYNINKKNATFDSEQIYADYSEINSKTVNIEKNYGMEGFVDPENISIVLDEVENLAKDYKSQGIIFSYERQSTSIYFEFSNGVGYLYTPTVKDLLSGDGVGKILTVEPYAMSSDFVGNYIISGKSPDKMADKISDELPNNYSFSDDDNWDSFSIEQTEKLGDHKIILWYGHGGYVSKYGSVLGTSIPITDQATLLLYQMELSNGEMILGKDCFCISPSYFEKHLEENSLEGSLVFLGACQSAMDNRLAEVFINKGASLVVGNSQTIRIRYMLDMMDDFMSALTNQYDDGTYWTAEDALAYAKSQNGDFDSEFWAYGAEVKLIYPASEKGYRLYGYNPSSTPNNVSDTPTTSQVPEKRLSESCDMLLCTGYDEDNYYELVANRFDGYPDSIFEFGVIKNNKWLVEMSSSCHFIDEDGWWKGLDKVHQSNTVSEEDFQYIGGALFLYKGSSIYNPETGAYFENLCNRNYTEIENYNEFLGFEVFKHNAGQDILFKYYNPKTGQSREVGGYFNKVQRPDVLKDISCGLFYASGKTWNWHNFQYTRYNGFFDLNGQMILDLSEYTITDYHGYEYENNTYTITCRNNSSVEFDITFDTAGKMISQTKATE